MAISVEITGANELFAELRALPETFQKPVILKLSQVMYDSAQKGAGRHVVTGALYQSLYNRAIPGGREVGHDANRAPHAAFVNFGTKPHRIPKLSNTTAKTLRWPVPGGFAFAKSVNHPGYRGDPYIVKAQDDALGQFSAIVDKTLKGAL